MAPQDQTSSTSDPAFPTFESAPTAPAPGAKRPQPLEKLKYRNLPFGAANTSTMTIVDRVDPQREFTVAQVKRKVDEMEAEVAPASAPAKSTLPAEKKEKKKSRKSEAAGDLKEKKSERKEKKSRKSVA